MSVCRHGLTSREATQLVTLFEKATDRAEQQELLERPREALDREQGGPALAPQDPRLGAEANRLRRLLLSALESTGRLSRGLAGTSAPSWTEAERSVLRGLLRQVLGVITLLGEGIRAVVDAPEGTDGT